MTIHNLRPLSLSDYDSISSKYTNFDFNRVTIKPSIDYVKFSIRFTEYPPFAVENLISHCIHKTVRMFWNEKTKHVTAEILFKGRIFRIMYWIFSDYGRTLFRIINPTSDFLKVIESIFYDITYSLSEVEYSLDFYYEDVQEMFCFFASHACLNRAGSLFNVYYDTTQYLNNIRKNKKFGSRIYIKNDGGEFLRLEMVVKQRAFKEIRLRTITEAMDIDANTVFSKLEFKCIKHENFLKNIKKHNLLSSIYNRKQFETEFITAMNSRKNCGGLPAVKKYMTLLKKNPSHYFKEHDFSYLLFERLIEVRFNSF